MINLGALQNTIYPDPESLDHLLQILLSVCESEIVSVIGQFNLFLDGITLESPRVEATNYMNPNYELQIGKEALQNKILNLTIEKEELARERIHVKNMKSLSSTEFYYIEPGLEGIRKALNYIKWVCEHKEDQLPEYLKNIELTQFSFSIGVVWKMYEEHSKYPNGTFDNLGGEADSITATYNYPPTVDTPFNFWFGNEYHHGIYGDKNYLIHIDMVQTVLDNLFPGKYEADPCDRDDLIKIGYLRRENRRHIIPKREEFFKLKEKLDELELEKSQKYRATIKQHISNGSQSKHNNKCNL